MHRIAPSLRKKDHPHVQESTTRGTGDFKSVVLKSRRESAHARTFGGDFELNPVMHRDDSDL